jgi:orotate phosphoribosyltransferase
MYPNYAELLGKKLAKKINGEIDIVVSPAIGGIIIGHEVAKALKKPFIFCERNEKGEMELRRNFEIKPGQKVLIVEDVVTTGKSTREVGKIVEKFEGEVMDYACIVERGKEHGLPALKYLYRVFPETYNKENCPLCRKGEKLVKPGSRKI